MLPPIDVEAELVGVELSSHRRTEGHQNCIIRWKHLFVFREFRPHCKNKEILSVQLWTRFFYIFFFYLPPSSVAFTFSHQWENALRQDESKCLNTFSQGTQDKLHVRQLMWSKVPLKARIQRRTRDCRQFIMVYWPHCQSDLMPV